MEVSKILLTGGSGTLGKKFLSLKKDFLCPSSIKLDITDKESVEKFFNENHNVKKVIHAAAFTNVTSAETNIQKTIDVNIIGTYNLLNKCIEKNIKLVFISTDYVFDGEKGDYNIKDPINPLSKYAKSKAAAELMVRMYENSLCIRTSFYGNKFPYKKAFIDQWTTKDYLEVMAPKILSECLSDKVGIVHCYSKKRTVYELAQMTVPDVEKITRKEVCVDVPMDTSLR